MQEKRAYRTRQKHLILTLLMEKQGEHLTAEQILSHLRQGRDSIGLTTVYRNLDRLVQDGVIIKYAGLDGVSAGYQYIGEPTAHKDHYHLVCLQCGRLVHLRCELINEFTTHIRRDHRFVLDSVKTMFYGYCEDCVRGSAQGTAHTHTAACGHAAGTAGCCATRED